MNHDPFGFAFAADPAAGGNDPHARAYPVDPHDPIVLDLAGNTAELVVRAVARLDVLVRAVGGGEDAGDADAPTGLHVAAQGNRIAVATRPGGLLDPTGGGDGADGPGARRRGRGGWLSIGRAAAESVDAVEVELPVGAHLRLHLVSGSGDVRLDGLGGELTVRSGSGDVRVASCVGRLQIDAGSGDIALDGCAGSVRAQTGSGDTDLRAGRLDTVRLRSGSGDLALRGVALGEGPFEVQTGSGDVVLDVARADGSDAPIALRYVALAGDAAVGAGFLRVRGRAADGVSPMVSVHTASGDLVARRVSPPDPGPPSAADPDLDIESARIPIGGSDRPPARSNAIDAAPAGPPTPPAPPSPPGLPTPPAPPALPDFERTVGALPAVDPSPPEIASVSAGAAPRERDERMRLLEQVARGDLDIEEALRRLG